MKPRGTGAFVLCSSMYGMVAPDPAIYHAPMTPNPIDYGAARPAPHPADALLRRALRPGQPALQLHHPGTFSKSLRAGEKSRFHRRSGQKNRPLAASVAIPRWPAPALFLLTDSAFFRHRPEPRRRWRLDRLVTHSISLTTKMTMIKNHQITKWAGAVVAGRSAWPPPFLPRILISTRRKPSRFSPSIKTPSPSPRTCASRCASP